MKRSIVLGLGWLVAGFAILCAIFGFDLSWNLLSFRPSYDLVALGLALLGAAGVTATWFLARATRDRPSQVTALVVCAALLALALSTLPPEPHSPNSKFRQQPSPIWFRGGLALTAALPAVFWVVWPLGHWRRSDPSQAHGEED